MSESQTKAEFTGCLIEEEDLYRAVLGERCASASVLILGTDAGYDECSECAGVCWLTVADKTFLSHLRSTCTLS